MTYINPNNQMPHSHTTVKTRILEMFKDDQHSLAQRMTNPLSQIHISCDGWTSPQQTITVLGVITHCTSSSGIQINPVIGLHLLQVPQTGANMADVVTDVLATYVSNGSGLSSCHPGLEPDQMVHSGLLPGTQRYPPGSGTGWNWTMVPYNCSCNFGSN
jgi:hypothetical protein